MSVGVPVRSVSKGLRLSFEFACQFASVMLGNNSPSSIIAFWKHAKTLPQFAANDMVQSASDEELSKMVPLALHGDGAEMYTDDEFFVVSWCSVFAYGGMHRDCLVVRYPISIVAERHMQSDEVH